MAWFSDIPQHNQMDVLKKLDFKQFVRFKKCCRETVEIYDSFIGRVPLECDFASIHEDKINLEIRCSYERTFESTFDEPVRLIVRRVFVEQKLAKAIRVTQQAQQCIDSVVASVAPAQSTTANGMEIEEIIKTSCLTSAKLHVNKNKGNLDSSTIDRLLRLLKAYKLYAVNYPSSELMQLDELKNIKTIDFCVAEMREADFLRLETLKTKIYEGGLRPQAVNKFFKQWNEDKRDIEELSVFPLQNYEEIFEDLDHSLIWSWNPRVDVPYSHVRIELQDDDEELLEVFLVKRKEDGRRLLVGFSKWEKITMLAMEIEDDEDVEEWIRENYEFSFYSMFTSFPELAIVPVRSCPFSTDSRFLRSARPVFSSGLIKRQFLNGSSKAWT